MNALELQNEQRAAVKLGSGGEARTGRRCGAATRHGAHLCFRGMLSTVHLGTALLSIGHVYSMKKAVSKCDSRRQLTRRPPLSLHVVHSLLLPECRASAG